MKPTKRFVLDLVMLYGDKGQPLTWEVINKHLPEKLRGTKPFIQGYTRIINGLVKSKILRPVANGWSLRIQK